MAQDDSAWNSQQSHNGMPAPSIPLQNLARPPDNTFAGEERGHTRGRSILSNISHTARYEQLDENNSESTSPDSETYVSNSPDRHFLHRQTLPDYRHDVPVADPAAFQSATSFNGLAISHNVDLSPALTRTHSIPESIDLHTMGPYGSDSPYEPHDSYFPSADSDRIRLTDPKYLQPVAGANIPTTPRASSDHASFHNISFVSPARSQGSRLGDDLPIGEGQHGRARGSSFGATLTPTSGGSRSRASSNAESAILRAGTFAGHVMRAMSQRVVNLSNDTDAPELDGSRDHSIHTASEELPSIDIMEQDTAYHPGHRPVTPEKRPQSFEPANVPAVWPQANPFRGKSLLLFAPDHPIRIWLCNLIVHPATEPFILVLIIMQIILLTIDASANVYEKPRPRLWGESKIDWCLLALFCVFTFELAARSIVSGLFFNPAEHSTINRSGGIKNAMLQKYHTVFAPHRQSSVKRSRSPDPQSLPAQPSIVRSFTAFNSNLTTPATAADFRRAQLARRAFLRHSLPRLDFVAVVAFWITFVLGWLGTEQGSHLYVFRMLSCLRIMRLLALTNGTSIILKSLKKATLLLVNVAFLIGFFWLLFAIVGVQAFKSSLDRQCVWVDPAGQNNFTNTGDITICGGYLDNSTGAHMPWLLQDGSAGATSAKGYLCPRGSVCQQGAALYNGTVSFDNIGQSLELVFVIMTANTFSDLMYYTTNSDYLASAIFFAAGIVFMMLWLTNLLIAVITSSFQVIREESDQKSAFSKSTHSILDLPEEPLPETPSLLRKAYEKVGWIFILVILYGTIAEACRTATMSKSVATFVDVSETVVTLILLVELVIRFAADWRHFHKSANNWMDLALATITTILILPPIRHSGQIYAWLTIFQLLRVYRIVMALPITRDLISKVLGNAAGIGNLMLFVAMITYLVSLLACQLFRGDIPRQDENGEDIHITFYNIWNSFLGTYQILSSENWTTILYNVTSYQNYLNIGWIGATFIVCWFVLSFFILINMFIAAIQENFDVSEDEKRLYQVKAFLQRKEVVSGASSNLALSTIFRFGHSKRAKDPLDYGQAVMEMLLKDAVVRDFLDEEIQPLQLIQDHAPPPVEVDARKSLAIQLWRKIKSRFWSREPNPFYSTIDIDTNNETLDARAMAREALTYKIQKKRLQREYLTRHPDYNKVLFYFGPHHPLRRFCQKIVGPGRLDERVEGVEPNKFVWYTYSAFIYLCILAMVIIACVATPLYQRNFFKDHIFTTNNWFIWMDLIFAGIFTMEALIKIIADGFFWTPNAYFRSLWGFIDGVVLVTLWINVVSAFANDGSVSRIIGAFKALRALRLLNVSDSARDTFNSVIFLGGWRVIQAAIVSLALLIPFAIYGVNLFAGKFVSCNDSANPIVNLSDCVGEYASTPFSSNWPVIAPRVATNPYYNFDNFGNALFILFQIVSQEGWTDAMWSAMSITELGIQPVASNSIGYSVFFVVFNLLGTVFILTLFLSVFMRTYTEQTGVAFLTAEQRSWLELRKLLRRVKPSKRPSKKNSSAFQQWCYRQATQKHGAWYRSVTTALVFHLVLLTIEFYPDPGAWNKTRNYIFVALSLLYVANIVIRIVGLSWPRFRRSAWDLYSLASVGGTLVSTVMLFAVPQRTAYIRLHKLFLVSIALLLIPRNDALDQLFKTAAASLSKIGNLVATWFVLFLVFAIAMNQTFGLTKFGDNETNNLNFRTVPKALIVLLRMSVGEGWNQIMEDFATVEPPFCTNSQVSFLDSDCGSSLWARILFVGWNILSMYFFVSLFVSLIYESFSYVYQKSTGLAVVNREEIRRYKQAWSAFDPSGTGFITKDQFPRLLGELSGVFGMRIYEDEDSVHRILEDVKGQQVNSRFNAGTISTVSSDVDLALLNRRISRIDSAEVVARRNRFNMFYSEVMVSADPDRGVSFSALLMILAHYNVITDSKSLKLDEFLRRRARLQRVEEEARRRVVVGFFDTIYWSRQFKRHIERRRASRMADVPTFAVPEIIIDDGGSFEQPGSSVTNPFEPDTLPLIPLDDERSSTKNKSRDTIFEDKTLGARQRRGTDVSSQSIGLKHNNEFSSSATTGLASGSSSPSRSPNLSAANNRPSMQSAFSFELDIPPLDDGSNAYSGHSHDPSGGQRSGQTKDSTKSSTLSVRKSDEDEHGDGSRRSSAVNANSVLAGFQDSAWGASLQRSVTRKKTLKARNG